MRSCIFIVPFLMLHSAAASQVHGGVEQYSYAGYNRNLTIVPRAYYQDKKNWYGEVRYNYEEIETISINAGKTFSNKNIISYSITPLLGIMAGKLRGGTLGVNFESCYKKVFFSAESEYAFSTSNRSASFFYNWSELGYDITDNIYAGMALQLTHLYKTVSTLEPGVMVGFTVHNITFPLFMFNPASNNRYFVVGINIQWEGSSTGKDQTKCISFY